MKSRTQGVDYSRPAPTTIADLLLLTLVVALFSAGLRPLIGSSVNATLAIAGVVFADLLIFAMILLWFSYSGATARQRCTGRVADLAYSKTQRGVRSIAFYITLVLSVPYQAIFIMLIANFKLLGPAITGMLLAIHCGSTAATLLYWNLARRRGAVICENGLLVQGSHFLPWRRFSSFRFSEVGKKLVLYEPIRLRFHYHEFDLPVESAAEVLQVVRTQVRQSH